MPTYSATFKRIDSDRNEDEKSMEITFYRDCCIGRSNFSALNKKIARKHVELKFADDAKQEGPVVMIKSLSKNAAFYWKKLKSDDTIENSDDSFSSADKVSRDEYLQLKSGDKFGVFENSFIYSININKNLTPISAQSSMNFSQKCDDDRSTSPTLVLSRSQELPDDDLDSDTDYGSESEMETTKDEDESSVTKSETLEKESTDVTLKSSSSITESIPERKRILPKWMLLTPTNSFRADKNDKLGGSRPTRRAAKNRRFFDEDEEFLDDEDETPAHSTRARRASKQEQPLTRTRGGAARSRARGDESDEDVGSAEEFEEDDEPERSPVRSRQKRAAAVRISSYAESEFVVNVSDFSNSDDEEKAKKRRKTESDEEYEDEPNEANNDSDFEISQSPNKSPRKPSSSPHRKGGHQKFGRRKSSSKHASGGGQRSKSAANRNAGRPPTFGGPLRRSSRRKITQSDYEDDEFDEKDEENKYVPRSSTSRSASNSTSPAKSPEKSARQACVYGAKCYRKNALHKKDYSHPGDPDWVDEEEKTEKRPLRNIRPKQNTDFVNSAEEDYYSSGQESEDINDDDSKDVDYGSRANRNRSAATSKKRPSNQEEDEGEELPAKKRPPKASTLNKRSRR